MSQPAIGDFQSLYTGEGSELVPWDIGGPQPIVEQLVAFGAVRGRVLDPGTGPGYHAIHLAKKGFLVTGIDESTAAIEQARGNAAAAGVEVDFQVADATVLEGMDGLFDTVIDSAFYHVFLDDEETQRRYATALHRATRPQARWFLFEFGVHNVNGMKVEGLPADNFGRVLPESGWRMDYVGTSTYLGRFSSRLIEHMSEEEADAPAMRRFMKPIYERIDVIGPLLDDEPVHLPFWTVAATRLD